MSEQTLPLASPIANKRSYLTFSTALSCSGDGQQGFTLIELLIVLAMVALISAVAIPGFSSFVAKSRSGEGERLLLEILQRQEEYRSAEKTYTLDLSELGYAVQANGVASTHAYYHVTAQRCQAKQQIENCVRLQALPTTPKDVQLHISSQQDVVVITP